MGEGFVGVGVVQEFGGAAWQQRRPKLPPTAAGPVPAARATSCSCSRRWP